MSKLTADGVGAPNNPSWPHFGSGWNDYFNSTTMTFEGVGMSVNLSGGTYSGFPAGPTNAILKYNGDGSFFPFTVIGGSASHVGVGSSSQIWVIGAATNGYGYRTYKWNPATSQFDDKGGSLVSISVGSDGEAWGVSSQFVRGGTMVYRWSGTAWVAQTPNSGKVSVKVGDASHIVAIDSSGSLYRWSNGWSKLGTTQQFDTFDVADDGTIVGHSLNDTQIYQWSGSTWTQLGTVPPGFITDNVYASSAGSIWGYFSNSIIQTIGRWSGGVWTQIPTAPNAGPSGVQANQYLGKDGSVWSFSNSSDVSELSIYKYVNSVWTEIVGGIAPLGNHTNTYTGGVSIAKDGTFYMVITSWGFPLTMKSLSSMLSKFFNCGFDCKTYHTTMIALFTVLIVLTIAYVGAVAGSWGAGFVLTPAFTTIAAAVALCTAVAAAVNIHCCTDWSWWGK